MYTSKGYYDNKKKDNMKDKPNRAQSIHFCVKITTLTYLSFSSCLAQRSLKSPSVPLLSYVPKISIPLSLLLFYFWEMTSHSPVILIHTFISFFIPSMHLTFCLIP